MKRGPKDKPSVRDALRWALDSSTDAASASADWLASDIAPQHSTAVLMLTDPGVELRQLRQAKSAYKTMRIVGETTADRRLGARLYAAAIAAALVWHGRWISRQSDAALRRAFQGLLDDRDVAEPLRSLAGQALCALDEQARTGARSREDRAPSQPRNGLRVRADLASSPRPAPPAAPLDLADTVDEAALGSADAADR